MNIKVYTYGETDTHIGCRNFSIECELFVYGMENQVKPIAVYNANFWQKVEVITDEHA